jgi:Na+-transporting methylmalonyl-CoA/oxaloacetate decarboxylase gamma subunit
MSRFSSTQLFLGGLGLVLLFTFPPGFLAYALILITAFVANQLMSQREENVDHNTEDQPAAPAANPPTLEEHSLTKEEASTWEDIVTNFRRLEGS